jgi:hypothetical protein
MKYVIKKYKEGYILKATSWFGLRVRYVRANGYNNGGLYTKKGVVDKGIGEFMFDSREEAEETQMILEGKL